MFTARYELILYVLQDKFSKGLDKWTAVVLRWTSNYRNRVSECDINSGPPDHEAARCPVGHDICENIREWWKNKD